MVGFECDVSDEQVVGLIAKAAEALGSLSGIVNNAGIIRDGLLVKKDRETGEIKLSMRKWQQVIDASSPASSSAASSRPGTRRTAGRRTAA